MKDFSRKIARCTIVTLLTGIMSGCSLIGYQDKGRTSGPLPDALDSLEISQEFSEKRPIKVAIVPFANNSGREKALDIVRQSFYSQFASKRYKDIELFEIDTKLKENGLYDKDTLLKTPPQELGKLLQADALIYGTISSFNRIFLGLYSQTRVELEVVLISTSSGDVLWRAKHKATSREADMPLDPLSVLPALLRTAANMTDKILQQTTDDLCRTLAENLPEPYPQENMMAAQIASP
jgi:hypothetical protein